MDGERERAQEAMEMSQVQARKQEKAKQKTLLFCNGQVSQVYKTQILCISKTPSAPCTIPSCFFRA
jgi:hypothetical protein